jgi:hypothetical protein
VTRWQTSLRTTQSHELGTILELQVYLELSRMFLSSLLLPLLGLRAAVTNARPTSHLDCLAGPGGWDNAIACTGAHRVWLMAIFYAAYTTDVLQLWRRPSEFARSFRTFMTTHHVISIAWFTPWLLLIAPRGVEGQAIWNTVSRDKFKMGARTGSRPPCTASP